MRIQLHRALLPIGICAAIIVGTFLLFHRVWAVMLVPSSSMEPALCTGDLVVGSRNVSHLITGEIYAFYGPGGKPMIKRLIATGGSEVEVDAAGIVYVDGVRLEEPYVSGADAGVHNSFLVPDGCLLFFGDNRAVSNDARYWDNPYIPVDRIIAHAEWIILPRFLDIA